MTISLLWLNDYLKTDLTPDQLSEALTSIGLEVEKMESRDSIMGGLTGIIAGHVITCEKHPDADRLSLTSVDLGKDKPSSIVCGANNIAAGQKVWVATPGTTLYDKTGKLFQINVSKIRGALSEGMICAEDELGLGDNHDGIIILPDAVQPGMKASDYYQVSSDTIIEIGLTPNRSDATSVLGVAEDLGAYLTVQGDKHFKVEWPTIPSITSDTKIDSFRVSVINEEACPRYSGVLISNIMIAPSPEWMQKRLQAIGVKTINNVVDITNFILHEMGQPLHAFDADKIPGREIIVETLPSGTPFLALDNQTYNLYHEDLMICDANHQPMCIGGVYGGLHSGVTNTTTSIFLEAAHFNAGYVRRTSMRHNLRTEAARRFEKGSDPNITVKALSRAADLISQFCSGKVTSQVFDIYPKPIEPAQIVLNFATLNAKTGISFSASEIYRILGALNMQVLEKSDHKALITVPTNKADVTREIDVIEEILRVYGFVNVPLPTKMQTSVAIESRFAPHRMRRLIGQFLSSRGFFEMMNLSLTQPQFYKDIEGMDRKKWVTIHNTSNESLNLMRPEMVIPILETVRRNQNRKQNNLRLFELGSSYANDNGNPQEQEHLMLVLTGQQHADNWQSGTGKEVDFFSIKSAVNGLLSRLGIKNIDRQAFEKKHGYAYGFELRVATHHLAWFGRVDTHWTQQFGIDSAVYVADFDFKTLIALASQATTIAEDLNKYPSVERDLAIIINDQVTYDEIHAVAAKNGGHWLTDISVFDVYANPDHVGKGNKSVALRFTIENKEATLSDKDLDSWFSKIQKAFVSELKAEIRK